MKQGRQPVQHSWKCTVDGATLSVGQAPIRMCFAMLLLLSLQSGVIASDRSSPLRAPRDIIPRPSLVPSGNKSSTKMQPVTTTSALHAVRELVTVTAYTGHSQPFKLPADTFSKSLDQLNITVTLPNGSALKHDYFVRYFPLDHMIIVDAGQNDVGRHCLLISALLRFYDGFANTAESARMCFCVYVETEPEAMPDPSTGASQFRDSTASEQTCIGKVRPDPVTETSQLITTVTPDRDIVASLAVAEYRQPAVDTTSKEDGLFLNVVVPCIAGVLVIVVVVVIFICCRSIAKWQSQPDGGVLKTNV